MKCDNCGATIGNTLYEVGEKRFCPICWLGPEEGSLPKYHQKTNSWTEAKLKAHKDEIKEKNPI